MLKCVFLMLFRHCIAENFVTFEKKKKKTASISQLRATPLARLCAGAVRGIYAKWRHTHNYERNRVLYLCMHVRII